MPKKKNTNPSSKLRVKKKPQVPRPKKVSSEYDKAYETVSWKAPEFIHLKRGVAWYVISALIFLFACYLAFASNDYVVLFVVVISYGALLLHYQMKPRILEYKITSLGIEVAHKLFPYGDLRAFSISFFSDDVHLNIEFLKSIRPVLSIPMRDIDIQKAYAILGDHLLEDPEISQDLYTRLSRLLKL